MANTKKLKGVAEHNESTLPSHACGEVKCTSSLRLGELTTDKREGKIQGRSSAQRSATRHSSKSPFWIRYSTFGFSPEVIF